MAAFIAVGLTLAVLAAVTAGAAAPGESRAASAETTRIDTHLGRMRDQVVDRDLSAAARTATDLRKVLA